MLFYTIALVLCIIYIHFDGTDVFSGMFGVCLCVFAMGQADVIVCTGGSSIWNLAATFFKLPISGTHTIVGATVGFSLCARGFSGVNWVTFGKIGQYTTTLKL